MHDDCKTCAKQSDQLKSMGAGARFRAFTVRGHDNPENSKIWEFGSVGYGNEKKIIIIFYICDKLTKPRAAIKKKYSNSHIYK